MKSISIKICGLTDPVNVAEIVALQPDYMGFILYKKSPRHVSLEESVNLIRNVPRSIRTVAVLVNEPLKNALEIAGSGAFDLIQLHGSESAVYCEKLHHHIKLVKAFSVAGNLPGKISEYEPFCSMFLFDTASEKFGGTGKRFDHSVLSAYSLEKEYFLSGGISPEDAPYLRSIRIPSLSGVDLNSRFEVKPGLKDVGMLKKFIQNIRKNDTDDR